MNVGEQRLMDFLNDLSGSFFHALFNAAFKADMSNFAKLEKGFPEEMQAVYRYQNEEGYYEKLKKEYWK